MNVMSTFQKVLELILTDTSKNSPLARISLIFDVTRFSNTQDSEHLRKSFACSFKRSKRGFKKDSEEFLKSHEISSQNYIFYFLKTIIKCTNIRLPYK